MQTSVVFRSGSFARARALPRVKQPLTVEFLFWEFTLDTEMELSSSERERLIAEREAAGG